MQRMKRTRKWILWSLAATALVAMLWIAFQPKPIDVDTVMVTEGPLVVTVNEDGHTRIKERYVVSSPLAGRLSRITLEAGDLVDAGETIIAHVEPTNPQLLDARSQRQAEALVSTASASHKRAAAELETAQSTDKHAKVEWKRTQSLFKEQLISQSDYEEAEYLAQTAASGLKSSLMAMQVAKFELEQAEAALTHTSDPDTNTHAFNITSPICGHVLRVLQESSIVVTPGMPLLELGDPRDLEVIVDVLSSDAVRIKPGARVTLDHWGGDTPLDGVVRLIEPAAFTKISALGVEEQRVWVVIDFTGPPEDRQRLGDGYRVEPRIVTWEAANVIKVPTGALFRQEEGWAVFVVKESVAELRPIKRGQSDGFETEILEGVQPGETTIIHPSERVADGVLVIARE
jgi:HlyD family secretion protein